MRIGGKTKPYAVLGHPIGHTLSPAMHNAALAALGWDAVYLAFDVRPERLMAVLAAMADMGFAGVNLTVPLKEVAFRGIDDLDESARQAGAVNTVRMAAAGGLHGSSTDGYGLLKALEEAFGRGVEGDDVVMLGSGGAARATALTCARAGARSLTIVARNRERAEALREELAVAAPSVEADAVWEAHAQREAVRRGSLVIQGTPIGLKPGDPPLFPSTAFRDGQRLYDMIYSFPETSTMKSARDAGAKAANGLGMLLHQGVKAFEIWTGETPPVECMRKALQEAVSA